MHARWHGMAVDRAQQRHTQPTLHAGCNLPNASLAPVLSASHALNACLKFMLAVAAGSLLKSQRPHSPDPSLYSPPSSTVVAHHGTPSLSAVVHVSWVTPPYAKGKTQSHPLVVTMTLARCMRAGAGALACAAATVHEHISAATTAHW